MARTLTVDAEPIFDNKTGKIVAAHGLSSSDLEKANIETKRAQNFWGRVGVVLGLSIIAYGVQQVVSHNVAIAHAAQSSDESYGGGSGHTLKLNCLSPADQVVSNDPNSGGQAHELLTTQVVPLGGETIVVSVEQERHATLSNQNLVPADTAETTAMKTAIAQGQLGGAYLGGGSIDQVNCIDSGTGGNITWTMAHVNGREYVIFGKSIVSAPKLGSDFGPLEYDPAFKSVVFRSTDGSISVVLNVTAGSWYYSRGPNAGESVGGVADSIVVKNAVVAPAPKATEAPPTLVPVTVDAAQAGLERVKILVNRVDIAMEKMKWSNFTPDEKARVMADVHESYATALTYMESHGGTLPVPEELKQFSSLVQPYMTKEGVVRSVEGVQAIENNVGPTPNGFGHPTWIGFGTGTVESNTQIGAIASLVFKEGQVTAVREKEHMPEFTCDTPIAQRMAIFGKYFPHYEIVTQVLAAMFSQSIGRDISLYLSNIKDINTHPENWIPPDPCPPIP